MKFLTTLFALAILCATASAQTIKALGYDTASGEVVANTGTNVLTFTNEVGFTPAAAEATRSALGAAQTIAKWKSATQSVTNSTTLVDDDTLFFETQPNARYFVRLYLMVSGPPVTGTHQFAIEATNATTFGTWRTVAGGYGTAGIGDPTSFNLAGTTRNYYVSFTVEGGTSAGEVKLRWAQGTANTNASDINPGSVLIAEKLP
jgi:hypothetical protein